MKICLLDLNLSCFQPWGPSWIIWNNFEKFKKVKISSRNFVLFKKEVSTKLILFDSLLSTRSYDDGNPKSNLSYKTQPFFLHSLVQEVTQGLFMQSFKHLTRLDCSGVTAMLSWGWLKLRLIEVEVDCSWGWLELRLIEVEVDWSWGWLKLK